MISKLPGWVWGMSWVMAVLAGMINVTGVLGFAHEAVTHLTGVTTQLGAALAGGDRGGALHLAGILGSLVAGATLCGLIVGESTLAGRGRYAVVFLVESGLLVGAVPLLDGHRALGVFLTCGATGMQNAMVTAFTGSVVRATHLSGLFTDLGLLLGQLLRGLPPQARRWRLCVTVISGFLMGAVVGAWCFAAWSYHTLLIPAGATAVFGVLGVLGTGGGRELRGGFWKLGRRRKPFVSTSVVEEVGPPAEK